MINVARAKAKRVQELSGEESDQPFVDEIRRLEHVEVIRLPQTNTQN